MLLIAVALIQAIDEDGNKNKLAKIDPTCNETIARVSTNSYMDPYVILFSLDVSFKYSSSAPQKMIAELPLPLLFPRTMIALTVP